jgi:hydrogenase nickel incorporation protein HypA/HybF
MHEWALAQSVVFSLKGRKPSMVKVKVGQLQAIDRECFDFALEEIMKHEGFEDVEIIIEEEKAFLRCSACGHNWPLDESKKNLRDEHAELIHFMPDVCRVYFRCPKCGSRDFSIEGGRGVSVEYTEDGPQD